MGSITKTQSSRTMRAIGGRSPFDRRWYSPSALAMAALAIGVFALCDIGCSNDDISTSVIQFTILCGAILQTAAVPVAHHSARHVIAHLYIPLYGGAQYVALQAAGWTIYALSILVHIIFVANLTERTRDELRTHWTCTVYGMMTTTPLLFISLSIRAEMQSLAAPGREKPIRIRSDFTMEESAIGRVGSELGHLLEQYDFSGRSDSTPGTPVQRTSKQAAKKAPSGSAIALSDDTLSLLKAVHDRISDHRVGILSPRSRSASTEDFRWFVVLTFAFTSFALLVLSDVVHNTYHASSAVLSLIGLATVAIGSVFIQRYYGPTKVLEFRAWMPFKGGTRFVFMQCISWIFVTIAIIIIGCTIVLPRQAFPNGLLTIAGLAGVGGQLGLFKSIDIFDPSDSAALATVFTTHGEGFVSIVLFSTTVALSKAVEFLLTDHFMIALPVICFSVAAFGMAMFLGLVALRKAQMIRADSALDGEQAPYLIAHAVAQICLVVLPVLVGWGVYRVANHVSPATVLQMGHLSITAVQCVLLFALIASTGDKFVPQFVVDARQFLMTSILYSIAAIAGVGFVVVATKITWGILALVSALIRVFVPAPFQRAVSWLQFVGAGIAISLSHDNNTMMAMAFWLFVCGLIGLTYGDAGETGKHYKPWLADLFRKYWLTELEGYFSLKLVIEEPLDDKQYLYGYHPHGIFPMGLFFALKSSLWAKMAPAARFMTVHGATVMFNSLVLKDFLGALGGRAVTRTALERSLDEGNSVALVPGGQKEMLTPTANKQFTIVTSHKGFIRLAIKKGVALVPVLSIGETMVMSNVESPAMQSYFLKKIGFPFPFYPHGRWFLPLPRRVPVKVCVGKPVQIPKEIAGMDQPPAEAVDALSTQYYSAVKALFDNHKAGSAMEAWELLLEQPKVKPAGKEKVGGK